MVPLHLSPDGRWLTLSVRPVYQDMSSPAQWLNEEVSPSHALVLDTTTGETRKPFATADSSWGGQWSPDGRWLAAYALHEGYRCLALWEVETGNSRLVPGVPVHPCFGFEVPQWLPDSSGVVLKLSPEEQEHQAEGASQPEQAIRRTVFSFDPALPEEDAPRSDEHAELVCDLGLVSLETGAICRLLKEVALSGWRVAPDGHAVATLERCEGGDWDKNQWNLVVSPLDGSAPRQIAGGVLQLFGISFNWSPDSQQIAYVTLGDTGRDGRLFVVDAGGASEPVDLTGDASLSLAGEGADSAAPCWSEDGATVYCLSRSAVWAFGIDGETRRCYTAGADCHLRYWLQRPTSGVLSTVGGQAFLAISRDPASKSEGIVRVDLATGRASRAAEAAQSLGRGVDIFKVEALPDGSIYYVLPEAANHPPEVWRFRTDSGSFERLSTINPGMDRIDLGCSRLIEYRSLDGNTRRAAVLLPPGYRDSERIPVVVRLYDGNFSNWIHYFGLGDYGPLNANLLASRGFAVVRPDLPLGNSDPMRQLPGLVLPAILRLVELGIADPERIGLIGFSYGSYLALGLLTQTPLFRAAVVIDGQVNMTSHYGVLTDEGYSLGVGHCEGEGAQGRMGGSLWERKEAYIENSPLFYLDRVNTPVLLVAGTAEPDDTSQAKQAFSALRRLGQRVELRLYHGEIHDPAYWSLPNVQDLCDRVVSWFETHLSSPG
jgi:dipeptidyl aminopeptidase/acylaminoacyl peptidase